MARRVNLYLKLEVDVCLYVCMSVQQKMNKIRLVLGWSSDIEDGP